MPIPNVRPFGGNLARKPFDERDPRAYDVIRPWMGDRLPAYALLGVPFDGAVIGRKGCAGGPAAVRDALRYSSSYNFEEDVDLYGTLQAADVGDIEAMGQETSAVHDRLTTAAKQLFEAGSNPIIVGGDNSITYAAVRALAASGAQNIGLLCLDAHLDVRVPSPEITSGTPNYLILERIPQVNPKNVSIVGLRRFANSRTYKEWALKKGVRLYPMKEIRRRGFQGMMEAAVQSATDGVDALYVSLDMDVVDQAWAPGVSSPSPDGLTPREVFDAVQMAGAQKVARGFEVVETAPNLDPTGNTARVAALALLQYLVGRAKSESGPKAASAAAPAAVAPAASRPAAATRPERSERPPARRAR